MRKAFATIIFLFVLSIDLFGQLPPVFDKAYANTAEASPLTRKYLAPVKII